MTRPEKPATPATSVPLPAALVEHCARAMRPGPMWDPAADNAHHVNVGRARLREYARRCLLAALDFGPILEIVQVAAVNDAQLTCRDCGQVLHLDVDGADRDTYLDGTGSALCQPAAFECRLKSGGCEYPENHVHEPAQCGPISGCCGAGTAPCPPGIVEPREEDCGGTAPDETDETGESREEFIAAVRAQAIASGDGRRVVHCVGGCTGTHWTEEQLVQAIRSATEVKWIDHWDGHDLAVLDTAPGQVWCFAVQQPVAAESGPR